MKAKNKEATRKHGELEKALLGSICINVSIKRFADIDKNLI